MHRFMTKEFELPFIRQNLNVQDVDIGRVLFANSLPVRFCQVGQDVDFVLRVY